MATFFRSLVRAGPSRTSLSTRNFTAPSLPAFRPSPYDPTSTSTPNSRPPFPPKKQYGMESAKPNPPLAPFELAEDAKFKRPASESAPVDLSDEKWWRDQSRASHHVLPGNQWSGRSIKTWQNDTMKAFKQISSMLSRGGVKQYVRRGEFHEKPSERKRRLGTERHRRRFQEMVREKVQTVQMIRNRG